MGFLIKSHLIVQITGSQQDISEIGDVPDLHLFIQPLGILAGMLQIFLHNMAVNDNIGYQKFLLRCQCQILRDYRALF